jgi:uncharacterized protein
MKRLVAAFWIVAGILIVGWMAASAAKQSSESQKELPQLKQFLYRVQPVRMEMLNTGPTKEEQFILLEHLDYLKKLTSQGIVIHAGRTLISDETAFDTVVFEADSEQAAREIMNNDPAVKKRVMRAALFPYRVLTQSRSRVRILPASP